MTIYGHDFYHLNFNDQDIPISALDPAIKFVILKFSQGTSYGTGAIWAKQQAARLRAAGYTVGGYHMLDGGGSSGAAQADYFLSVLNPQPGDIIPSLDFEGSGQGSQPLATYKANAEQFIARLKSKGFDTMLYGHSVVKAAWADWRNSGAVAWWVPGDQPWSDVGPVGPDLWQYSPYNTSAGPHSVNGHTYDASKVLTSLPLIGGGDEMAYADFKAGVRAAAKGDKLPANASDDFTFGYNMENRANNNPKPIPGPQGPKGDTGPQGPKGDAATIAVGTKLVVSP